MQRWKWPTKSHQEIDSPISNSSVIRRADKQRMGIRQSTADGRIKVSSGVLGRMICGITAHVGCNCGALTESCGGRPRLCRLHGRPGLLVAGPLADEWAWPNAPWQLQRERVPQCLRKCVAKTHVAKKRIMGARDGHWATVDSDPATPQVTTNMCHCKCSGTGGTGCWHRTCRYP